MSRKRVIYQSESLYCAATGTQTGDYVGTSSVSGNAGDPGVPGSGIQVHRVQSINYGFDVPRQDVNEFGKLARIDQVILESPTVSLDFTYYAETGFNERTLGFTLEAPTMRAGTSPTVVSSISGILNGKTDIKSYFIRTVSEGRDEQDQSSAGTNSYNESNHDQASIIAIGNASITSYTFEAAVGSFPTVSVSAEGLNMRVIRSPRTPDNDGSGGVLTAATVNQETGASAGHAFVLERGVDAMSTANNVLVGNTLSSTLPSALRPGDIRFTDKLTGANDADLLRGWDISELKIQSVSVSVDLGREDLLKLGSKFAFSKEVVYPVTASMTIEASCSDMKNFDLSELIADDSATYTAGFYILRPGESAKQAMGYRIVGAKLDSEALSSSIGDNKTVTFNMTAQVGGPSDSTAGLFIQRGES
tara:strand:- start:83 stop:1339 length:1257 start_codon:yes stop_codon:yes gene_type:complete